MLKSCLQILIKPREMKHNPRDLLLSLFERPRQGLQLIEEKFSTFSEKFQKNRENEFSFGGGKKGKPLITNISVK